jgi:glycosyltransferase involved in cell wall biosynthesis
MKILHITDGIPPHTLGGAGRIAWETCLGLTAQGHETSILTAGPTNTLPQEQNGIHIRTLPNLPHRFAHYSSVLSKKRADEVLNILNEEQPDLVHAHVLAWHMGYRWMEKSPAPIVFTAHDTMTVAYGRVTGREKLLFHELKRARWTINPSRNALIRKALTKAKKRLCVSDALRTYLESKGLPAFQTLHNGIDIHFWKENASKKEAQKLVTIPPDVPVFLLAGRIGPDKGSTVVAKTLPENAHLILAGHADWETFTYLGKRLHVLPNQGPEEMRVLYSACDVALVPSVYLDPFPTICLEAMACSRPVLATCFGGAKEAVKDGETGWIIDPTDTASLQEHLAWCAAHREELVEIGQKGRRHVETHFSLERYLGDLLAIYEECLSS